MYMHLSISFLSGPHPFTLPDDFSVANYSFQDSRTMSEHVLCKCEGPEGGLGVSCETVTAEHVTPTEQPAHGSGSAEELRPLGFVPSSEPQM